MHNGRHDFQRKINQSHSEYSEDLEKLVDNIETEIKGSSHRFIAQTVLTLQSDCIGLDVVPLEPFLCYLEGVKLMVKGCQREMIHTIMTVFE